MKLQSDGRLQAVNKQMVGLPGIAYAQWHLVVCLQCVLLRVQMLHRVMGN